MTSVRLSLFRKNYAFIVVAIVFVALLTSAGLRATPGVLLVPLEKAFGWSRDTVSLSAAIGIFLYGFVGPFAAGLMQHFGIRRTVLGALALMALSVTASAFMTAPWQLIVTWGILTGLGSGCVALVLAATIVNRWFVTHRGLVMGLLMASTASGNLIFLPGEAALIEAYGWQMAVGAVATCLAIMIPLVYFLLPEWPSNIGLKPYGMGRGARLPDQESPINPLVLTLRALRMAVRSRDFWLLFFTFFVCGFTTNGLIGTHLIAMCSDHGLPEVRAASLLAMMGVFDLIGTTLSGWLTDRFDGRKLLFIYYTLRGLSLLALPYSDFSIYQLSLFSIFYGLDWVATIPPTLKLTNRIFGEASAPVVFGWILVGHQSGAATAAFVAGVLRVMQGRYLESFILAGFMGLAAAAAALLVNGNPRTKISTKSPGDGLRRLARQAS